MKNLFFGRQEETQNRPLPISERAKEVMHNHFGEGADFYIGLDPAVLLGDPEVVTAGILFIPITLLIAIGAMYVVCMFFAVMHSRQRAIEVAANRDEDDE